MTMLDLVRRFFAVAVLCAAPSTGAAQDAVGGIAGRVTGADGAPLHAVQVTARSSTLIGAATTTTSASGDYLLPRLPPGEYVLTFEGADRVTLKRTGRVGAGHRLIADVVLVPARDSDAITVTIDDTPRDPRGGSTTERAETLAMLPLGGVALGTLRLSAAAVSPATGAAHLVVGRTRLRYVTPASLPSAVAGVEEVTVAAHNLSAEIGWLDGGSLSITATPGSDRKSGAARAGVGGASFLADAARSARPVDGVGRFAEVAAAGPIRSGRTWFAAGVSGESETRRDRLDVSRRPFATDAERSSLRGSLTHAFSNQHRILADAMRFGAEIAGARETETARVFDARALAARAESDRAGSVAYDGVIAGASATARLSSEVFTRRPDGPSPATLSSATPVIDQGSDARWWAPECAGCEPGRGRRDAWRLSGSGLIDSRAGGHEWTAGYEGFRDRREPGARPGGTYRLRATPSRLDTITPVPRFAPGESSWVEWEPGPSSALSVTGHSLFVADRWRWRETTTLSVGLRWDQFDVTTGADDARSWTERALSPRISIAWVPAPHSPWLVTGGIARYVDVSVFSPWGVSFASPGTMRTYAYDGPAINTDVVSTDTGAAVDDALAAFFDGGGLSRTPLFALAAATQVDAPGPPATTELTLGVDRRLGMASHIRADLFWRDVGRIPALAVEPGRTSIDTFGFALDEAAPVADVFTRRQAGLAIQGRYRLGIQAHLGASYLLSRLWGNVDSGPGGLPVAVASAYAEYAGVAGLLETTDLRDDVRHRLRFWGYGDLLVSERIGTLSGALFQDFSSGSPYGAVGLIDPRPFVANPGYARPPAAVPYAFTARDAFRGKPLSRTDLALTWIRRVPGTVFGQFVVHVQVLNLFDKTRPIDAASVAVVRSAFSDPDLFEPYDPTAGPAVRDVHWAFDPRWQDVLAGATTMPRAFRFSFGVRF